MYWYNFTKSKYRFKKPIDMSGVKLSDFENFSSFRLMAYWIAIRHTSTRRMGPVLFSHNTDLLFEEDLSTAPSCFLSSFEVQSSSRMVRNNKLNTDVCTWIINAPIVCYLTCMCYACIELYCIIQNVRQLHINKMFKGTF